MRTMFALVLMMLSATAVAELKIAVLDTQRAIFESEEAKAISESMNAELQKQQDELKELQESIEALQTKLRTDGDVMSPSEKRSTEKEIEDKGVDFQFLANKLQKEVQDRRQELLRDMVPKVDAVLKDLIELEGYDVIMERSNLHYVNSKHDITRRVTEKLNAKEKS